MTSHHPTLRNVCSIADAEQEIKAIGSDQKSLAIMAPKMILKVIKLQHVVLQDAIIIKQDMLSVGGEVAIPRDAFELKQREADILVIGTLAHHQELVGKLKRHYPRIQKIAEELAVFLKKIS
jgi:dihydropteroate synthase